MGDPVRLSGAQVASDPLLLPLNFVAAFRDDLIEGPQNDFCNTICQ